MSEQPVDTRPFIERRFELDLGYVLRGINCHALLEYVCPPKYGLQVLEPGCCSGKLGIYYWVRGAEVTLLDINESELLYAHKLWEAASQHYLDYKTGNSITFLHGSIHKLPFPDNRFDLVFNEGVPQHWGYNPRDWRRQRSINEMVRVVKPGGHICVIANNALCPAVIEMANSLDHSYKGLSDGYKGMPAYEKPFTPDELAMRLERAGIKEPYVASVDSSKWEESALIAGFGVKA